MMPRIIETGMEKRILPTSSPSVVERPRKTEKIVIAKTSSTDAPARIMDGTSFFLPIPFSIRSSIEGTITAGETAASIKAVNPDMIQSKLKK